MRAPQHALATVGDAAQLDAGAVLAGRGRRADHDQPPQRLAVARDRHPRGAWAAHRGRLVGVGDAAAAGAGQRGRRRLALEAHDLAPPQAHADDLVVVGAVGGSQADGDDALDPAVGQLFAGQRRHRAVGDEAALAQSWAELGVLAQDLDGGLPLVRARHRLARGRDQPRRPALVERHVDEQRPLVGVVVERGAHAAGRHGLVARVHGLEADEPGLGLTELRPHGRLPYRRACRLLEPVGVRTPRLDLHLQLTGHRPILFQPSARVNPTPTRLECGAGCGRPLMYQGRVDGPPGEERPCPVGCS